MIRPVLESSPAPPGSGSMKARSFPRRAHGPVAVVTGASSGIGAAAADALTKAGYTVFGASRSAGFPTPLDVRDAAACRTFAEAILGETGRIDVLVNAAGLAHLGSVEDIGEEDSRAILDINLLGALWMTRAVLPAMRNARAGRIVHVSSIVGLVPAPFMALYAASKHALEGLSESLDHEIRPFGVRSILVEPGFTRTRIGGAMLRTAPGRDYEAPTQAIAAILDAKVRGGMPPERVAKAIMRAATLRDPPLRIAVGQEARLLSVARRWMPQQIFARGVRHSFGLN